MIRVLHVIHGMDCGGTENLIMNLYRHMDRDKVQFDFLVHTTKHCFFDDEILRMGGQIYRAPYYKMYNALQYKKAVSALFRDNPQWSIIHGHLGSCACIYLREARKFGLFTIAHSHAIKFKDITLKELLYRGHAVLTRGVADYYMACSKQAGIDRYGKKIANGLYFSVLNNSIDSKEYDFNRNVRESIRKELNLSDDIFVMGHIGRMTAEKNHLFMLDVLKEVIQHESNVRLLFVGDGPLKEIITLKAKELGLDDYVIMTGVRRDVPKVLMAMDAFLFPSKNEGLGISLVEAQASGLKCLASEEGIPKEAKISDLVEFLPLAGGCSKWANRLLRIKGTTENSRHPMSNCVRESGYDIVETSQWLEHFYFESLGIKS